MLHLSSSSVLQISSTSTQKLEAFDLVTESLMTTDCKYWMYYLIM